MSEIKSQYIEANGLKLYYETAGSGQPVIFLHGSMGTGNVWKPYIPFLSQAHTLFLPDARGHGKTHNPGAEIDLDVFADDVAAFIDALELEKPILCGWSMGGDIGLNVAMRYPDSIKGVVAGGVTFRVSDTYFSSLRAMGLEGPGQINFEQAEKAIPQLVAVWKTEHTQSPEHWKELITYLSPSMLDPQLPSADDLKRISVPALILLGDRDQFLPLEDAIDLYRLIPHSQLAVIPHADHFVTRMRVELVADLIKGFTLTL